MGGPQPSMGLFGQQPQQAQQPQQPGRPEDGKQDKNAPTNSDRAATGMQGRPPNGSSTQNPFADQVKKLLASR